VENAIEHGEGRPVKISLRADADAVAVVVRDHGVGLRPQDTERVFLRFWRADPARTRTSGGTGLGLSIAREDALLHNGWLHAWGRSGQGAAFRLVLPRRCGEQVRSAPLPLVPESLGAQSLGSQPLAGSR
jgi:two-component system sensor histidine kinase MtrB